MDNGLTTLQFLGRCAFFSVLWIATIFGIVYPLSHIDATVVMALFACSAALVYLLSWVLLHQQFVGVRVSSEAGRSVLFDGTHINRFRLRTRSSL